MNSVFLSELVNLIGWEILAEDVTVVEVITLNMDCSET